MTATKKHPSQPTTTFVDGERRTKFYVTVQEVVGEVTVDPYGDGPTPREAAFALIAQHGTDGTYEFPLEDGGACVVHVENHEGPAYEPPAV